MNLLLIKDDDALSVYKIQSSHTIHMVKGVSKSTGGSSTGSSSAPQQLPAMQAGQNVHDPLTQLNSHLGYGAMAGLNPFSDMGLNPNDPNLVSIDDISSQQSIQKLCLVGIDAGHAELAAIPPADVSHDV